MDDRRISRKTSSRGSDPVRAVSVHVDACPSRICGGHVDSIQRGAGQAFALLPAENATGNYVKVVQRVPVKIVLEESSAGLPARPGNVGRAENPGALKWPRGRRSGTASTRQDRARWLDAGALGGRGPQPVAHRERHFHLRIHGSTRYRDCECVVAAYRRVQLPLRTIRRPGFSPAI